jgi:transposase
VDQSGSRTKRGSITRQGSSLLRWVLIQAVWVHIRYDTLLTRYFHRIVRRKGGGKKARKRAAIATARKMLHVIYAMLRDGKPFDQDYLGRDRVDCVVNLRR